MYAHPKKSDNSHRTERKTKNLRYQIPVPFPGQTRPLIVNGSGTDPAHTHADPGRFSAGSTSEPLPPFGGLGEEMKLKQHTSVNRKLRW